MEALTGASVAALKSYHPDSMTKAVSHRVEFGSTVLVNKTGASLDLSRLREAVNVRLE